MTLKSSRGLNRRHSSYLYPLSRFLRADRIAVFGPVGFPVIALRFRRGVLVGILESNGAKQKTRECSSGGLVLDQLVVCRFYGIDTSIGLVVPPIPLAFNAFTW